MKRVTGLTENLVEVAVSQPRVERMASYYTYKM
jgi:hypothetical protein